MDEYIVNEIGCDHDELGEEMTEAAENYELESLEEILEHHSEILREKAMLFDDIDAEDDTEEEPTFEDVMAGAVSHAAREMKVDPAEVADAIDTPVRHRDPRQCEIASLYQHREPYRDQVVFTKNAEGEIEETGNGRRTAGSQVPDGVYQDKDGEYHLLEVKDTQYKGLGPHLLDQLHQREEFFGENTDVLFSISGGKLTFGEAEALQRYAEKNGINIEFMLK